MSAHFQNYIVTHSSYTGQATLATTLSNHGTITNLNNPIERVAYQDQQGLTSGSSANDTLMNALSNGIRDAGATGLTSSHNPDDILSVKFRHKLDDFEKTYDFYFPSIPCAHCGSLLLPRSVCWREFDDSYEYGICKLLEMLPHIRTKNDITQVAMCHQCDMSPRQPPHAGPWPDILVSVPQRSRMFLSPLTLQTSLGRTHGYRVIRNPYSTYRTLTGMFSFAIPVPKISLPKLYKTTKAVISLFGRTHEGVTKSKSSCIILRLYWCISGEFHEPY